ncbi:MAG: 7-carboxy-7-deazaguanine synthase QueE [Planctomycetaceae bacterium]|jgi:7-carboxy-7-deazaguanine synthase|nr:7-carboxy-7-deazaguanine synthase QueE [Planctomycetaceae bacterium]
MRIIELFCSKQGEGILTGTLSAFIRTGGCNLCCQFCDTRYAAADCEEGEVLTPEQIVTRVEEIQVDHVVITGGEPMLWSELESLTSGIKSSNKHITIETAGTIYRDVKCDLMSISPKLSNSDPVNNETHKNNRRHPEVVSLLIERYNYQLKFVVDTPTDLEEIETYIKKLPNVSSNKIQLMPQGTTAQELESKEEWLKEYCEKRKYTFTQRMQIIWYGNKRGC